MKKSTHDIEILTADKRDIGEAFPKGTQMFGSLVGRDGAGLYRDVGGDGAGFLGYLFGGTDIGEPAPTGIMWCH